jgi:hypothetical protein
MNLDFAMPRTGSNSGGRARDVTREGAARFGSQDGSWINGFSKDFSKVLATEG